MQVKSLLKHTKSRDLKRCFTNFVRCLQNLKESITICFLEFMCNLKLIKREKYNNRETTLYEPPKCIGVANSDFISASVFMEKRRYTVSNVDQFVSLKGNIIKSLRNYQRDEEEHRYTLEDIAVRIDGRWFMSDLDKITIVEPFYPKLEASGEPYISVYGDFVKPPEVKKKTMDITRIKKLVYTQVIDIIDYLSDEEVYYIDRRSVEIMEDYLKGVTFQSLLKE